MARLANHSVSRNVPFEIRSSNGAFRFFGSGYPAFTIHLKRNQGIDTFMKMTLIDAAEAFIEDSIDVEGDLPAAVAYKREQASGSWHSIDLPSLGRLLHTRSQARHDIDFHYSKPPEFYRLFLDPMMVYSCGYFKDPAWSLERAQLEKLELICRKLRLRPGESFLDIGCGWGALVIYAAQHHHVHARGCTVSATQQEYAHDQIDHQHVTDSAMVELADYRDEHDKYLKIASIGMCEHIGRSSLGSYFSHIFGLLLDGGLFLNQCIVRPRIVTQDEEIRFLRRNIFPGGDLPALCELIEQAELAGFEILDLENLRLHYALTCRAWLNRLIANENACTHLVGRRTYRTWMLYLAASAATFEAATTDVVQITMTKRFSPAPRVLTRDFSHRNGVLADSGAESKLLDSELGASWL